MSEASRARALLIPILIITGFLGIIHFFIWRVVAASLDSAATDLLGSIFAIALILLPVGVLLSYTSYRQNLKWMTYLSYIWLGFFHLMFHFSFIQFVVSFFYPHDYSYWVLPVSGVICLWAIFKGFQFPKVTRYWLKAPAFLKGKTLVQVSDLHVGMLHLDEAWLGKVVDQINATNPDFVAITGDLVEGPYSKISPQLKPLKNVKSAQKFYVTGNHEYIHFSSEWENRLKELGFTPLHNSSVIVKLDGGQVLVAGVPDRMVKRFVSSGITSDPEKALQTSQKTDYKILLAHEPSSVFDLKNEKPDVILSGHTHGGQIFPFSLYVLLQQPVVQGFKLIRSTLVFAHQGTGFWGPPMRWFTQSEIAVFEFID